jgi:anhydro-N-acetylmuramic acid kinase
MRRLRAALDPLPVETSSAHGIDPDAREAIAFAIIGNQTLHGLPGNAPAATGAAKGAVLGKISLPADSAS